MKSMNKDLAYYLSLPYTRRVRLERDEGGEYFVAYVVELGGLESDGLTESEARYNLQSAFVDYLTALLSRNATIAEPELWPGPSKVLRKRRAFFSLISRQAETPIKVGISQESVVIDPLPEWSQPESEVRTSGSMAGV